MIHSSYLEPFQINLNNKCKANTQRLAWAGPDNVAMIHDASLIPLYCHCPGNLPSRVDGYSHYIPHAQTSNNCPLSIHVYDLCSTEINHSLCFK